MTMTNEDEELLLTDKLLDARNKVERIKRLVTYLLTRQNRNQKDLEVIEQAFADYFEGNGLIKLEAMGCIVSYSLSSSVDIADPTAVPEEFIRRKIVSEPDKIKIRNEAPRNSNWFTIKQSPKITVRSK